MNRVLRWSPILATLLVLGITGCGGCNSSEETRVAEKPPWSESAPARAAPAADNVPATRTVVLHVTGMMKSKSGAT